jgi:DNA-binding NarL/FixJ family response regulator
MATQLRSEQSIRVLIADDHPVVRNGMKSLFAGHVDLTVVGEARDGGEVLLWLAENEVDVILLDIQMEGHSGIEIARQVRRSHPGVKIIILTTFHDENYLYAACEAGVHGFLLKSVAHESLPDAIRAVASGQRLLDPET